MFPACICPLPYMSQRDRNDILFGIEQGIRSDLRQLYP